MKTRTLSVLAGTAGILALTGALMGPAAAQDITASEAEAEKVTVSLTTEDEGSDSFRIGCADAELGSRAAPLRGAPLRPDRRRTRLYRGPPSPGGIRSSRTMVCWVRARWLFITSATTMPMTPATMRMKPTVEISIPLTLKFTAKARIAPIAIRTIPAPMPMVSPDVSAGVSPEGNFVAHTR